MGQSAISCTDRKRPDSLPELRLTVVEVHRLRSIGSVVSRDTGTEVPAWLKILAWTFVVGSVVLLRFPGSLGPSGLEAEF
jgi:hypothetical protein